MTFPGGYRKREVRSRSDGILQNSEEINGLLRKFNDSSDNFLEGSPLNFGRNSTLIISCKERTNSTMLLLSIEGGKGKGQEYSLFVLNERK